MSMAEHDAHEAAEHADSSVDRDEVLPHIVGHLPGRRAAVILDQPDDDREAVAEALCERDDHPWALLAPDEAAPVAVDRILHPETFDALATMLGYIKPHSAGDEFCLRVAGTDRIDVAQAAIVRRMASIAG